MATPRVELRRALVLNYVNIDQCVFELVSATLYMRKPLLFLIDLVYIQPNSSESEYMALCIVIEKHCDNCSEVAMIGDFNLYSAL